MMSRLLRNIYLISLVSAGTLLFQACDEVDDYYEDNVSFNPERKVLVEDYTGHKCGNCPRATRSVYDLKSIYGDNLIIIGVHAGFFATPNPPQAPSYKYDFRNTVSTELDTDFGISFVGNPNGMVNRRKNTDGSHIFPYTSWADEAAKVLFDFSTVPASITINNSFDESDRSLSTEVTTEINLDLPSTYRLSVYLVEDHITNWQKDYDVSPSDIPDYDHREVLRGSLNGTYGDPINSITKGSINTNTYNTTISQEFDASNCYIVAFLYSEANQEIIEVEQTKVIP
jgi:hypothetical protein